MRRSEDSSPQRPAGDSSPQRPPGDSSPNRPRGSRRSREEIRRSLHERFVNAMEDLRPLSENMLTNSTIVSAAATSSATSASTTTPNIPHATTTSAETGSQQQMDVDDPTGGSLQFDFNGPTSPPPASEFDYSDEESTPATNASIAGSDGLDTRQKASPQQYPHDPRLPPPPQQLGPRLAPPQASRTRQQSPHPRYEPARHRAQLDQHRQEQDDVHTQIQPQINQLLLDQAQLDHLSIGRAKLRLYLQNLFLHNRVDISEAIQEQPSLRRFFEIEGLINEIVLGQAHIIWPDHVQVLVDQLVRNQLRVNEIKLGKTVDSGPAELSQLFEEQLCIVLLIQDHRKDIHLPAHDLDSQQRLEALRSLLQTEVERST